MVTAANCSVASMYRGRDAEKGEGPAHVDQQQLRSEDPDEGQEHRAQRIDGSLDAVIENKLGGLQPQRTRRITPAASSSRLRRWALNSMVTAWLGRSTRAM